MSQTSASLPGEDIVREGLEDLAQGRVTDYSLLVQIAAPRLRGLGLNVPEHNAEVPFEHQLYERLEARMGQGAHSYYNSLIRRIVSFARSCDRQVHKAAAPSELEIGKPSRDC